MPNPPFNHAVHPENAACFYNAGSGSDVKKSERCILVTPFWGLSVVDFINATYRFPPCRLSCFIK